MRKFSRAAAISLLISLLSTSASMAQPVVDGTKDADYGGARAVQTIQTGFGNNQSEWNAGYATVSATDLFLMLTGNLEDNFNKLEIFIDSVDSGTTNVYSNPQNNDGTAIMDGMTFDTGFTPDYHIIARHGAVGMDNRFDLDFIDLAAQTFTSDIDVFSGFSTGMGVGANTGIAVGFDNSNMAGIGGDAGMAADQSAALMVTTGLELGINLAALGSPNGTIRIMLLQNNQDHNFLSNQTLAGLPVGTMNLGSPANAIDFSGFDGNQYFSIVIPEPATAGLLGMLATTGLMIRRRR